MKRFNVYEDVDKPGLYVLVDDEMGQASVGGLEFSRAQRLANEANQLSEQSKQREKLSQGGYITLDSGERAEFSTGMVRDTHTGKARFDLLFPAGQSYDDLLLTRVANLMARGAEKYDERNWEKASTKEEHQRFVASALRHMMQWAAGRRDEDHAAAVVFNLMGAEFTREKLLDIDPDI